MVKYKAKPDTWFDEGAIVELIDDYRPIINGERVDGKGAYESSGLFCGLKNGKLDEEVCFFEEFEVIDEEKV